MISKADREAVNEFMNGEESPVATHPTSTLPGKRSGAVEGFKLPAPALPSGAVNSLEQTLLLRMAQDNARIAADALQSGMPLMARQHLQQALKEIELAGVKAQVQETGVIEV